MLDISDDEQLLFRHRAQVKGIEGEVEIVLTNTRLSIASPNSADSKSFAWANIAGVKYSPANDPKGRAMVLLKTVIQGSEDVVITLVGPTKEQNFSQQEAMKSIISQIRKTTGKSQPAQKPSANISGVKRTPTSNDLLNAKRRQQLLESDRYIAKQYRDLVEVNKILSEEDFWSVHAQRLQQASDVSSTDQALSLRGKQNSLIPKSFTKDANGVINVDLTLEMRQNIFSMYPEVRKAFDAEVPLKRTETEFWTVYLHSEYYNSRSGSSSSSGETGRVEKDDLFARYSEAENPNEKKKTKLQGLLQHQDVDLTASFGDYRAAEPVEVAVDSESTLDGSTNLLSARYNRNSSIVVGEFATQSTSKNPSKENKSGRDETILSELLQQPEPSYIQVRFKDSAPAPSSSSSVATAHVTPASTNNRHSTVLDGLHLADPHQTLQSLHTAFPSADRSTRLFSGAIHLQKKVAARHSAAFGGQSVATSGSTDNAPVGQGAHQAFNPLEMLGIAEEDIFSGGKQNASGIDEGNLLDESFKQVLFPPYPGS